MKTKCPDCCYPEVIDIDACGCCEGAKIVTPLPTANRPGLSKLAYRIGTHASFLETMMARLSSSDFPKLSGLTTRDPADPSIALLDAWATVADVLTFYQERIANEGYLPTATERRSILELANLVGYKLRPGVASSVFLAYTIDDNVEGEVTIPTGTRTQSIPGPDELPQTFETSEDLKARAQWNNLRPRMTRPQTKFSIKAGDGKNQHVYLKGVSTNLESNDPLLIDFGDEEKVFFCRVKAVVPDAAMDRTLVTLQAEAVKDGQGNSESFDFGKTIKQLILPPSNQVPNSLRLSRKIKEQFGGKAESSYKALSTLARLPQNTLAAAMSNAIVTEPTKIRVYALRSKAHLFGHNYPGFPVHAKLVKPDIFEAPVTVHFSIPIDELWPEDLIKKDSEGGFLNIILEPQNEQIQNGSLVVIERPVFTEGCAVDPDTPDESYKCTSHEVAYVKQSTLHGGFPIELKGLIQPELLKYLADDSQKVHSSFSSKVDVLTLDSAWLSAEEVQNNAHGCMRLLTDTVAYTQSEELYLAEEPMGPEICQQESIEQKPIELDGFYEGLEPGRWVIVSGERAIEGTSGVRSSELAMLASVRHSVSSVEDEDGNITNEPLPDEKTHTFITLAEKLEYCFNRDSVTIYGNVVKATHGETRQEVLGSGDGSKAQQSFELKQLPLTHVAASNPAGADSTLKVIVNDMQWHEVDSLAGLETTDRNFITKTDVEAKTTITFGNGKEGARLPTGVENIRAEYRNGIGKPGNVKADQISLLIDKPLGVKEVVNPDRASGGADRESRDLARKNAPLAVKALDRLVSVQDYEDFARTYAGIGKARAVEITDGRRQIVHVTIAGADDIPIDKTSDLFRNLRRALHDFGDPYQPIKLAVRELMLMVISARVRLMPDYQWEPVVVRLREALLYAFGFEVRELGQDVLLSEVIAVIQAVRGIAYVDVDTLGGVPEKQPDESEPGKRRMLTPDEISECVQKLASESAEKQRPEPRLPVNLADFEQGTIRPAQLAFLTPDVPETLILNQIE